MLLGFCIGVLIVALQRVRRRLHRHTPRLLQLTDPDSPHARGECDCETVMPQARCPPHTPLRPFLWSRCACGVTEAECQSVVVRGRLDGCCPNCYHRPAPTAMPGPGEPMSR